MCTHACIPVPLQLACPFLEQALTTLHEKVVSQPRFVICPLPTLCTFARTWTSTLVSPTVLLFAGRAAVCSCQRTGYISIFGAANTLFWDFHLLLCYSFRWVASSDILLVRIAVEP